MAKGKKERKWEKEAKQKKGNREENAETRASNCVCCDVVSVPGGTLFESWLGYYKF
jgi:hypothetical protein